MQRVLILDADTPLRTQLQEALERVPNIEVVVVSNREELIRRVSVGLYAAVFADGDLLDDEAARVIAAVRSAISRPMFIIASNERHEDLDPELVTLIVRKPYDVQTVVGILLAAVSPQALPNDGAAESQSVS